MASSPCRWRIDVQLKTPAAVILGIAVLALGTHAHGHGISIRVHESQDVVTLTGIDKATPDALVQLRQIESESLAVTAGCAAGMSQELSRQALAGVATGVEFVQTSSLAVCVQRVDADKGVIEVRDVNDEVFTLSVADAEPPLDRIAVGDTITLTVRRAVGLRRLPAPPVEELPPQP
jgi:hypothetical protein